MMETAAQTFQRGLGARIDALQVALGALQRESGDGSREELVNLARSLAGPAGEYGLPALAAAAERVCRAPAEQLVEAVAALIEALRTEAARVPQWVGAILLVGGDAATNRAVTEAIASPAREVVQATTASAALRLIQQRDVMCVVLNLVLPDVDGRAFLERLRENALTASIPVLLLAQRLSDDIRESSPILDGDSIQEGPIDIERVAAWVNGRLRRSRESVRAARRDPLTGLLNRAAFREVLANALDAASGNQETMALALVSVDEPGADGPSARKPVNLAALARIGAIMSGCLRATDVLARWGLAEFAVLFPGEDQFGGTCAVEKVLKAVRAETFETTTGEPISLPVSAGVAALKPGASVEDAISEADRFLFQAASRGGSQVASSQTPGPRRPDRVLLLMADEMASRVVQHLFERDGFAVTRLAEAHGPIMPGLADKRFDLIVIDEALPGVGGFAALTELREAKHNSRVPIVMLIAGNAEESMARALELGANDYVMRPFSPFTFIQRMRRLLKRGGVRRGPEGQVCRVLIVDAELRNLLLAASALHERGGFRPYLANSVAAARERWHEVQPEAAIIDGDSRDAPELAKFILDLPGAMVPVIVSSSRGPDAPLPGRLTADRVAGVMSKPFNALSLGARVEELLHLQPSSQRAPDAAAHLKQEIRRASRGQVSS